MAVSAAVWNKMHRITFITGTLALQILVHLAEPTSPPLPRQLAALRCGPRPSGGFTQLRSSAIVASCAVVSALKASHEDGNDAFTRRCAMKPHGSWVRDCLVLFCLLLLHATPAPSVAATPTIGSAWLVVANADGSFSPSTLHVRIGDLVTWSIQRGDTIIPIGASPDVCSAALPHSASSFAGPMPVAPGGLFTINPAAGPAGMDRGLVQVNVPLGTATPCGTREERARGAVIWTMPGFPLQAVLCASGPRGASMASTWQDPDLTGVAMRILWNSVHLGPGQYDFTMLDAEIAQAVANGKLYSLAFTAGKNGTPAWIFDVGGVPRVSLQDKANDEIYGCGVEMDLGPPHDPMYQLHYFDMLTAVAAHLKTRADWYRALAYVKPSGANLFTNENRLPKRCDPGSGCFCNTEAWSLAGYRPELLEAFYAAQHALIVREFPGKTISYEEINAGFPRINTQGGYVDVNGNLTAGKAEILGTAQTQAILDNGQRDQGLLFSPQHDGLETKPPPGSCPGPTECPQELVVIEGAEGQYISFQTNNISKIVDSAQLESALENGWENSTAGMIEIYEERLWQARSLHNLDIATWDRDYRDRRAQQRGFPSDQPSHSHVFVRTIGGNKGQVHTYINGTRCDPAAPHTATILVDP
jgi:hypothetical protein